jgi:protoporphyrinogen oxidase
MAHSFTMNIAIIGAGATGLSAAWDLLRAGHRVTIYEASDKPGGLASGFKQPNWDWSVEKFYHHWFASDADLLKLADELGVREKVVYTQPRTVSYWNGNFYPLDSPLAALKFPGLSLLSKIPFGLATIYLKLMSNGLALEKFTAHAWASKWMGKAAYNLIFEPLLQGKFGDAYYKQVNMAWLWARLKSRTPSLGTFDGGFQAFFDVLADKVKQQAGNIRYQTRVEKLSWAEDKQQWRVELKQAFTIVPPQYFDRVLVTTSPKLMSQLAPQLPSTYLSSLNNLKSLGAIVMTIALDRPLSPHGYYWHSLPKKAGFPFLALCEHTNFIPKRHFGGQTIVYCGDYLEPAHPYFKMSEEELRAVYLPALKRINPAFELSWVQNTWTFREAYAQPIPLINHSANIPSTQTPLPGLFFASMSQVYPWDRGTNYAVKLGREVAAVIAREKS